MSLTKVVAKPKLTHTNSNDSNFDDKKQQQLKNITSIVRALVISCKPPTTLRSILREYPEVESEPIPFRKLGYNSAEELLRDTGEFIFNRIGNEICITAKYNQKTSHIASMVRSQKSGKSRRNRVVVKQVRHPLRSDQSWNKKSTFSSNIFRTQPAKVTATAPSKVTAKVTATAPVSSTANRFLESINRVNNIRDRNNNNQSNTKDEQQKYQLSLQKPDTGSTRIHPEDLKQHQKGGMPRPILGQNNHSKIATSSVTAAIVPHQHMQEQQSQQQLPQYNATNAFASSMILAQREQQIQEQRQQNRVELLCMQQQQQQKQLLQQQEQYYQQQYQQQYRQQQEYQLLQHQQQQQQHYQHQQQQENMHQRSNYKTTTPETTTSTIQNRLKVKINNVNNNGTEVAGGGSNSVQTSPSLSSAKTTASAIQNRVNVKINNNNYNGTVVDGGGCGGISAETSPSLSSAGLETKEKSFNSLDKSCKEQQQQSSDVQGVLSPKKFEFNLSLDPVTSLSQYCEAHKWHLPEYSVIRSKMSRLYQCRVNVNNTIYFTYPNEYPTEHLAKISCATLAMDQIKLQELRRALPPCTDSDDELIEKFYTELLLHPHGMFVKNMSKWFEGKHQQTLPAHWWSLMQSSTKFITEEAPNNNIIVFANKTTDKDDAQSVEHSSHSSLPSNTVIRMEGITLPWTQKCWDLYITHCASTVEVWARLFGKEYSEKFDSLMSEIELYMGNGKARPLAIVNKQIYLVCITQCWHRVRVEEVDKLNGTVLCFFIDFGDADWLSVNQLHICEPKFLKLPPQAVPFSLFGLEDLAGSPHARRHLDAMLANKSLVGEILTKEANFYAMDSAKIQVVLYDTSSQDDVNLNPLLLKKVCDDTSPPELKRTGVTNVLVTHVSDAGDLYLQVLNSELKYVQKLLERLIGSKFKHEQHKVSRADLKRSNLFLVCDDTDSDFQPQWYRGALTETLFTPDDDEFEIFYVDNGQTRRIHISKIFNLGSLSAALSNYPRQAIKARLYNIPKIDKNIVGRMRALMPPNCEVLVKVSESDVVPLITIYRRLEGPDTLCTINDVIRIEHELEICSDACGETNTSSTSSDFVRAPSFGAGGGASPTSDRSLSPLKTSFIEMTRGLTITTSVPNSPLSSADLPRLQSYSAFPLLGEFFEVCVTMSANPSNFMVQPYKDYPHLRSMMKELQEYCENNDEFIPVDMVEIGQAYAAKNPDGFYHRVVVVNTYSIEMIHVCFCDFGDVAILRNDQLKILPAQFRHLPKMAVHAKLYGISARHVDWTLEDCMRFRGLTVGQKFVSIIKRVTYDKLNDCIWPVLDLDLVDVTTDEDIYIRELLLNEERAIEEAPENSGT